MATKHTDPCIQNAADDEPVFTLRGRDILAPSVIEFWAESASRLGSPAGKVSAARADADAMRKWQRVNGCKVPD